MGVVLAAKYDLFFVCSFVVENYAISKGGNSLNCRYGVEHGLILNIICYMLGDFGLNYRCLFPHL